MRKTNEGDKCYGNWTGLATMFTIISVTKTIKQIQTHCWQLNLQPPHFALVNGNRTQLSPFIVYRSPAHPHPNIHAVRCLYSVPEGQVVVPIETINIIVVIRILPNQSTTHDQHQPTQSLPPSLAHLISHPFV